MEIAESEGNGCPSGGPAKIAEPAEPGAGSTGQGSRSELFAEPEARSERIAEHRVDPAGPISTSQDSPSVIFAEQDVAAADPAKTAEPEERVADAGAEASRSATGQQSYSAIFAEPVIEAASAVVAESPMMPSPDAVPSVITAEPDVEPEPREAPSRGPGPADSVPAIAGGALISDARESPPVSVIPQGPPEAVPVLRLWHRRPPSLALLASCKSSSAGFCRHSITTKSTPNRS